jgi:hypothetical protein
MKLVSTAAVALVVIGACATESEYPGAVPRDSVLPGSTMEPEASGSSALAALEAETAATFEGPRRELAELIVSPGTLANDMQLVVFQVEDPNDTGRIDGRWYPPRVRTEDCAMRVDAPPVPSVSAAFVPGDPEERLGDDVFAGPQALMEAPLSVSIQTLVFDDSSQRDGLADAMVEFYRTMGELDCEAMGSGAGGDFPSALLGDVVEVPLYETGFSGFAFELDGLMANSLVNQYSVGERVLLTVTVAGSTLAAEAAERRDPDPALARRAIDAEIARLQARGLG